MEHNMKMVAAAVLAGAAGLAGAVTVPIYPGSSQSWSISGAGVPAAVLNEYVGRYQSNCLDKSQRMLNMIDNATGLTDAIARKADALAAHEQCSRTTFQMLAVAANQAKAAAMMTQANACMGEQQNVLAALRAQEKAISTGDSNWESRVNGLRGQQKAALQTLFNCKANLQSAMALSNSASAEIQAAATAADQCLATYSAAAAALPLPVAPPPIMGVAQMTRMRSTPKLTPEDQKQIDNAGNRKLALANALRSCMRPATQKFIDVAAYAAPSVTPEVATVAYVSRPATAGAEPTLLALSPAVTVTPDTRRYCMPGKSLDAAGICQSTPPRKDPAPPAQPPVGQCTPDAATGLCLYSCPAFIYLHNGGLKAALSTDKPKYSAPNGNPHCLYTHQGDDRSAGTFDRVAGKAVDWFPLFTESYAYGVSNMTFTGQYIPVYSNNLSIQGAYCSNPGRDPYEYGYFPGTCRKGGNGKFSRMCMIDTLAGHPFGDAARKLGMTRVFGGGDYRWGNYGARMYNGSADGSISGGTVTGWFGDYDSNYYGSATAVYYPGGISCGQAGTYNVYYTDVTRLPPPGSGSDYGNGGH